MFQFAKDLRIWWKRGKDTFPPELSNGELTLHWASYAGFFVSTAYLMDQFCFQYFLPGSLFCTYIALGAVPLFLLLYLYAHQRLSIHEARREDKSEIDALIAEAKVKSELSSVGGDNGIGSSKLDEKKEKVKDAINALEKIGILGWTEYQVLRLDRLVVELLDKDELQARARSTLTQLRDYAEDSFYSYDSEQYFDWKGRIEKAIKELNDTNEKDELNNAKNGLRAELKDLLEYLANYEMNWSEGSARVRTLMVWGVVSIPVLVTMGLLPFVHSSGTGVIGFLNWGLLGISGSLAAVLFGIRKSNLAEVGNTEGRMEARRAILGTALGFVAAILTYSMITGGLIAGELFPDLKISDVAMEMKEIGRSVFWAISSGFYFELVFDRMRSTTTGNA